MIYIVFILLVLGTIAFLVFTYESKISDLQDNLIILNSTISHLKSKLPKGETCIKVEFQIPNSKLGLLKENSPVYLSPDGNGLLEKTKLRMEVKLLDQVNFSNGVWFYVSLPVDRSSNCRGWVQKKYFASFE